MRVRIRLFAIQRQLAGTRHVDVDLPDGATVEDGWRALVERFPVLAPGRPSVRFAVDGSYADADAPLHDGAELASIPPVSGGAKRAPHAPLRVAGDPTPAAADPIRISADLGCASTGPAGVATAPARITADGPRPANDPPRVAAFAAR